MALTIRNSSKWICHHRMALASAISLAHSKTNLSARVDTLQCCRHCSFLRHNGPLNRLLVQKWNANIKDITRMASELHSNLKSCDPVIVSCDRILNLVKQFHKTCESKEIVIAIQLLQIAYPREKGKWIFGIFNDSRMKEFVVRISNRIDTFSPNELLDVLQGLVVLGGSVEERWMQNILEKAVEARRFFSDSDCKRLEEIFSTVSKGHEDSIFVKSLSKQFTIKRFS